MSVQEFEFKEVKFYEYTIRMTTINNICMYLVSDIIKQYNEINHTDKRIRNWMLRKDTQELLQYYRNTISGEYFHSSKNNKEKINEANASLEINKEKNDNYRVEDFNNFGNIPGVIMKIDYKINNNITNKAFIVNSAILHDILMWIDKVFAHNVCTFLDNMRSINNDRFTEILKSNNDKDNQISLLQDQIKEYEQQINQLKSRYTPETYNWHFCVTHNELTNIITTIITKDQYKPVDKNVKRVYDLICCNPLVLEQQLIDILVDDQRFTQISNKEFTTTISNKNIFWFFKNKCKKLRNMLEWKTGITN